MEKRRTLWNAILNGGFAAGDKCSIFEGITRYPSSMRLIQDYLEEGGASVWFAKKRALLKVWLWWLAALLNLDGTYGYKLLMLRSGANVY